MIIYPVDLLSRTTLVEKNLHEWVDQNFSPSPFRDWLSVSLMRGKQMDDRPSDFDLLEAILRKSDELPTGHKAQLIEYLKAE